MKKIIIFIIKIYKKFISPVLPPSCRFYPTCSAYAVEAVTRFGVIKGGWLAFKRILRCNPYCRGGFDPVPLVYPKVFTNKITRE
jgi:uncharacterized protein